MPTKQVRLHFRTLVVYFLQTGAFHSCFGLRCCYRSLSGPISRERVIGAREAAQGGRVGAGDVRPHSGEPVPVLLPHGTEGREQEAGRSREGRSMNDGGLGGAPVRRRRGWYLGDF